MRKVTNSKTAVVGVVVCVNAGICTPLEARGGAVFTAGIGENSPLVRKRACTGLDNLGISIDDKRNTHTGAAAFEIQTEAAAVKVLVVATNEELEIAQQAAACIRAQA